MCVPSWGKMTNDQLLLCIGSYMDIIDHVKKVIRASGRKSYTMVMGKLNVAKMANFMEVDCYVLVACPENSLIDSKVNIPLSLSLSLACSCSCFFTHIIFHFVPFGPFFLPIPLLLFSLDQGVLFYLSWLLTCMCAGVLPPNCHPF